MRKTLLLFVALLSAFFTKAQLNIPPTELNYNVHYHWGLIDINIAHGQVNMSTSGDQFNATLDGNSIPWNGRVFCISDTLQATMTPGSPLSQETVTYQNGWYLKPKVQQYRSDAFSPDDPANYKNIHGQGTLNADGQTMEAVTVTSDMLAMFYYYRQIDFESMQPGQQITIPISGGFADSVLVTYKGKSTYNTGGMTYQTYDTEFEYSYHGVMSGYQVQAQVSVGNRIPVLLSASLPVGHVEMIYEE